MVCKLYFNEVVLKKYRSKRQRFLRTQQSRHIKLKISELDFIKVQNFHALQKTLSEK